MNDNATETAAMDAAMESVLALLMAALGIPCTECGAPAGEPCGLFCTARAAVVDGAA